MPKDVLLLGARGMLGSALARVFGDENLTAWDKQDQDLTEAEDLKQKILSLKPALIINASGYTNVDGAESNREEAFAVNAAAVGTIARAAKEAGAKVVHYSTDYVFPGDRAEGYEEQDKPGPAVNVYGESKLAGEQELMKSGVEYWLLRTAWLYGASGKNFVDTMLKLSEDHDELKVVDDQHGCPTYAADLAEATRRIMETKEPGIYHAVNAGTATWYEFALEIFRLSGKEVKVAPVPASEYPRPAKRPVFSVLKDTKGVRLRPWQEALEAYLIRKH